MEQFQHPRIYPDQSAAATQQVAGPRTRLTSGVVEAGKGVAVFLHGFADTICWHLRHVHKWDLAQCYNLSYIKQHQTRYFLYGEKGNAWACEHAHAQVHTTHTHTHTHTCTHTYTCTHTPMHIYVPASACTLSLSLSLTHTHTHTHIHACTRTHTHTHTHTHAHTHTHTHTHTRTRTHTHTHTATHNQKTVDKACPRGNWNPHATSSDWQLV